MKKVLIGHTGFVGGNLARQGNFTDFYNSTNIETLRNQHVDELWCAGVRAVKWWANQHPTEDQHGIDTLVEILKTVSCSRVVHISTVDVFKDPRTVNEHSEPTTDGLHPYGLHRLQLEHTMRVYFPSVTVVRLPGLFGQGLQKNIIYDFLHTNQIDNIHSQSRFQFYDLNTIYKDCCVAQDAAVNLVHLAVEPVAVDDLAREVFGFEFHNKPQNSAPALYDMHTRHAHLFGRTGNYIQNSTEVFEKMRCFVKQEKQSLRE